MNEEEFQEFRSNLGRPIAGQSLTNDPDNPAPFERAPEFTELDSASLYLWTTITDPEVYAPAMEVLSDGTPIMDLVQLVLKTEFQKGMFNPDLMILLIEPLAYMFLALAERLDIDPVFYRGQEEDDEEEERIMGVTFEEEKLEEMKKAAQSGKVPAGIITSEMKASLSDLPELEPAPEPEPTPIQNQQPSLMAAPQEGI
tara:strand:+ start:226 stop:822 length:597 start_codon:yes stop_codon:yes gene_type:complete